MPGVGHRPQQPAGRLAVRLGADAAVTNESALEAGEAFTGGRGFDAILITADTKSSEPVVMAAIWLATGRWSSRSARWDSIPRKVYYEKELDFRLSRSYGPGRYDPEYEEKGHDYPYGYVRWTEQRNIEAFVQLVAEGKVDASR